MSGDVIRVEIPGELDAAVTAAWSAMAAQECFTGDARWWWDRVDLERAYADALHALASSVAGCDSVLTAVIAARNAARAEVQVSERYCLGGDPR